MTTLLSKNEEISFLRSSVLVRLHGSKKRQVNEEGVCNDYWIHMKLMREACATITESTWKASGTAILSNGTMWLLADY